MLSDDKPDNQYKWKKSTSSFRLREALAFAFLLFAVGSVSPLGNGASTKIWQENETTQHRVYIGKFAIRSSPS